MLFRLLSARAAASPQAAPNPITGNHGVLGQIELSDRGGMRGDEPAELRRGRAKVEADGCADMHARCAG